MPGSSNKNHFVLVHGICHGAWCWYKLATLLKLAGHQVTALDLGGCGVNPKKFEEISSMADYVEPLMDFMAALPDDDQENKVVLVGHSYGGLCIPLAMQEFPHKVSIGVFVSAYLPHFKEPPLVLIQEFFKGASAEPDSTMDSQFTFKGEEKLPDSVVLGSDYVTKMYRHCELQDIELGKMLVRPNGFFMKDMAESLLTEEKYGSVRKAYVLCEDDPIFNEEMQRFVIDYGHPQAVKSISGAGHMVMLSKPEELCKCLQDIAEKC